MSEEDVPSNKEGLDRVSSDLISASGDATQTFLHHVVSGPDDENLNQFLCFDKTT